MMHVLPGLVAAAVLAGLGTYIADRLSAALGLGAGAVSGILIAVLLGLTVGSVARMRPVFQAGIELAVKHVLRLGIVLLGLRLSLVAVGSIGLKALPVLLVTIPAAIVIVTHLGRRFGLPDRLGTLIAVGTSICGNTAIVAVAPTIGARDEETSYAVACVTVFGLFAMLTYPFLAHALFGDDPLSAGIFLGSAVHDTSQVAGAGMVYQEYFRSPEAMDAATVTKLGRNLSMLLVIPLMSIWYHRRSNAGEAPPPWWKMVPAFVLGFAAMSALRTVGDLGGERPFGVLNAAGWRASIEVAQQAATACLAIAMAGVGLGTRMEGLRRIGIKPLALGLASALLVGALSAALVSMLY